MADFTTVIPEVRAHCSDHAQNIFIQYFTNHKEHQNYFSNYRGKAPGELTDVSAFAIHTTKVLSNLLDIAERTGGDVSKLGPDAVDLKRMPQHLDLKAKAFRDLFNTIIPYFKHEFKGKFHAESWITFGDGLCTQLQASGMKP